MSFKKSINGGRSRRYQISSLFAYFFLFNSITLAQQTPYYTQHENWEEIKVNWTNLDTEIEKKFLPFPSSSAPPHITRDYPYTYAGRAVSHTFSANGTFYVGFSTGGLWRMITYPNQDSISWKMITTNDLLSQSIGAVIVNPKNENHIIVATGTFENGSGRGIYYTEDGGLTWNLSSTPNNSRPNICYAFTWHNNQVFLANSNGLYVSADHGKSWKNESIHGISNSTVTDITSYCSTTLFAAVRDNGIYKKTGSSWTKVNGVPVGTPIDLDCSNNHVYALANEKLYSATENSGFTLLNAATNGSFNTLKVASDNSAIYVGNGGGYIYKSIDQAITFTHTADYGDIHIDQRGFAMDPRNNDTIYAICDGGVYRSKDAGSNWYNLNIGLQTFQCTGLESYPHNIERIFTGTQDNGSQSCVGGLWTLGGSGDSGSNHYALNDSTKGYEIRSNVLELDMNNYGRGVKVQTIFHARTNEGNTLWLNSLDVNKKNTDVQYLSTINGLYKTTNAGEGAARKSNNSDWELVVDLPNSVYRSYVNFVAVGTVDTSNVYFMNLKNNQYSVYKSNNSGQTWTSPEIIAGNSLFSIVNSPNKAGRSFIVGGNDWSQAEVFISDNYNDPYTKLLGKLPPMQAFYLTETPKYQTGIIQRYIANQMGIYWSFGTKGRWFKINNNLPNVQARDIEYHALSGNMRVATYGRGIWQFPCPVFTTADTSLTQVTENIYGCNGHINVQNNVTVSKPKGEVNLIAKDGVSFGTGFSVSKGTEFSVFTFEEIK